MERTGVACDGGGTDKSHRTGREPPHRPRRRRVAHGGRGPRAHAQVCVASPGPERSSAELSPQTRSYRDPAVGRDETTSVYERRWRAGRRARGIARETRGSGNVRYKLISVMSVISVTAGGVGDCARDRVYATGRRPGGSPPQTRAPCAKRREKVTPVACSEALSDPVTSVSARGEPRMTDVRSAGLRCPVTKLYATIVTAPPLTHITLSSRVAIWNWISLLGMYNARPRQRQGARPCQPCPRLAHIYITVFISNSYSIQ